MLGSKLLEYLRLNYPIHQLQRILPGNYQRHQENRKNPEKALEKDPFLKKISLIHISVLSCDCFCSLRL